MFWHLTYVLLSSMFTSLILDILLMASVVAAEPGGYCNPQHPRYYDARQDMVVPVCVVAYRTIQDRGDNPLEPHPYQYHLCGTEKGCISNLGSVMRVLWCESRLYPDAEDEGYVGVDINGDPVWNHSRGIAQIGNGWGHRATDEQAFDWVFSVQYLAQDPSYVLNFFTKSVFYPECGIDGKLVEN